MYISGVDNCKHILIAGREWYLHLEVFQDLHHRWGMADLDLLASRFNNKWDMFVFKGKDPLAEVVDALVSPWDLYTLCLFFSETSSSSAQQK